MWSGLPAGRPCWRQVWMCVTSTRQKGYRALPCRGGIYDQSWGKRSFGLGDKDQSDNAGNGNGSESQPSGPQQLPRGHLLGRRRPLSPLERISCLLPQDSLSHEVWELRDGKPEEQCVAEDLREVPTSPETPSSSQVEEAGLQTETTSLDRKLREESVMEDEEAYCGLRTEDSGGSTDEEERQAQSGADLSPALPGERSLRLGELVLAEFRRKGRLEFRKMFALQERGRLHSNWGFIPHGAIVGQASGTIVRSSIGSPILLRRPSLEEYVLLMRRAPTIAYPKDASAILMMMDVTEGDSVLESGSGSGAMTLFLSRAVGSRGSVLSVKVREDHHRRAVRNYQRWRSAWSLRRGEEWPDNVCFHHDDLQTAAPLLAGRGFHCVALDMLNPQLVLPTVFPHLHHGAVCAVYLANVTQVIDLLEGVRHSKLPLQCERVMEVQYRDWLLAPAVKKDGNYAPRVAPSSENHDQEEERHCDPERDKDQASVEENDGPRCQDQVPFGTVPYIARPHPEQGGHTAFLVKLRKVVPP